MKRFEALLVDFGGVCLKLPFELHREVEASLGLPSPTFTWCGPVALDTDPLWREILEGRFTEREYWKQRAEEVGRAVGREFSVVDYMRICCNRPEEMFIRAEALETIRAVRAAGLRVGVLTNDLEAFLGPTWKDGVDFFREVDTFTDVSHRVRKPEPGAYAEALTALGVEAEKVLFVDDQPENVAGAERAGIAAIHFRVADPAGSWQAVRAAVLAGSGVSPTKVARARSKSP